MVYYRKYRPQTINDLDNAKLRDTLHAVLSGTSIPHAFLFTGPKGLGKTSTARIIAKVINCEHIVDHTEQSEGSPKGVQKQGDSIASADTNRDSLQKDIEPCNECYQCISITNGTNIDVLEIDGASNRGIDEIRDLREKVKLAPSQAKKKVYIIDEVHMLTTEAFNALLKTIEEPPSHVMFIFCTTEPHKVPATIVSRCFHISLSLATEEELVRSFKRIATGESLSIDEEALHYIARLADGGFRDGVKILEELVQLANGAKITKEFSEATYHTSSIAHYVTAFLGLLSQKKAKDALSLIQEIISKGIDIKYFLVQLLEELHRLLLVQMGINNSGLDPIEASSLSRMTMREIGLLVSLLSDAYQQTKTAVVAQLPLEMAIIAFCTQQSDIYEDKNDERDSRLRGNDERVGGNDEKKETATPSVIHDAGKPTMDTLLRKQEVQKVQAMISGKPLQPVKEKPHIDAQQADITTPSGLMDNLIYKMKSMNATLAGVLRSCTIKDVNDQQVILEAGYKFHKDKLEESKSFAMLEQMVREITGKPLKVMIELRK
jgi:DNA polymerase-3 subunit gamma/tau